MWSCPVRDRLAEDSSSRDSPTLSRFAVIVFILALIDHHHPNNLLWGLRLLIRRKGWVAARFSGLPKDVVPPVLSARPHVQVARCFAPGVQGSPSVDLDRGLRSVWLLFMISRLPAPFSPLLWQHRPKSFS